MTNGIGRVGWRNYVSPLPSPLWDNLTHYYSADNTTNDAKVTYNGTLVNGATYSTGKIGSAFSFDGINDYMSTDTNSIINSYFPHSYSCWVNPSSTSGTKILVGNSTSMLGFRGGNNLTFFQYYVNAEKNSGVSISANTWSMVTVTYKGAAFGSNNVLFYVNGSLVHTGSLGMPSGGGKIFVGSNSAGSGGFYGGLIDEVGVWNRTLTAAEVTELYNAGAGKQYVAPTPTYTTRTAAFAIATGITDTTILGALNTFDTGLISNGLATKMKALYPFVGGTSNTHKFNFMDAQDTDAAFRIQFNGGWTHSSTGAKGNGTNTYANTFFNQFSNFIDWNKSSIGIYSRTNETGNFFEGNDGFAGSNFILYPKHATLGAIFETGPRHANSLTADSLGLIVGSSISASDRRIYKNGVKLTTNTNTNTDTAGTGRNIYFGALNTNNIASYISNKQYSLMLLMEGMSDADQSTLYTLVQAMQTSLSRQV